MVNDTRITKQYLTAIKTVAKQNHIPLKFVLIPEIKEADVPIEKYTEKYKDLLSDSVLQKDWLIPQNQKSFFNNYPDAHLNNQGHRFYADYLKSFLKDSLGLK